MIKHIIFDWDGTLARSLELWLEGYKLMFERHGYGFSDAIILRDFFYNHNTVPAKYPDIDFATIADQVRNHVLEHIAEAMLYDHARHAIYQALDRLHFVSLVSSSARGILQDGLRAHALDQAFHSIVAGDDGYGHKPDPMPFAKTLERSGCDPSETLIIGDSKVDIQAGKALGCQTCFFAPAQNELFHDFSLTRALKPDFEIDRLDQLGTILGTEWASGSKESSMASPI